MSTPRDAEAAGPDDPLALTEDPRALAAGLALAEAIAVDAIWDGDRCAFHGATPSPVPNQPVRWRVFGGDYYEGSAGIARVLGHAAALGGSDELARTALGAITHALERATGWSLYQGQLGVGLVATELGGLLDEPELARTGRQRCLEAVGAAMAEPGPVTLDLLGGLAGVLHAASRLAAGDPGRWSASAHAIGERLAAAGEDRPTGRSWPMVEHDPQHLCGLAHGAAGVALAFEDLAVVSDAPDRWSAEAAAARGFERAHHGPAAGSWADLRTDARRPGHPPSHPHLWCHGSVGIGHERLRASRRHPGDAIIGSETAVALRSARRESRRIIGGPAGPGAGFEANASQCHGLSGLIELLLETGDEQDTALAREVAGFVRRDAARPGGHRSGNLGGEPAPGLMIGSAGIAWGQLRAATGGRLPCAWTPVPDGVLLGAASA